MARKSKTNLTVAYRWNQKDQPERLNRVFDMLFAKVIKKLLLKNHEDTQA